MRSGSILSSAFVVVACSGSVAGVGPGTATVNGTVSGQPVAQPTDEVGLIGSQTDNGITASYAGAVITNVKGTCSLLQQGGNPASATALFVVVTTTGNSVAAGTYAISKTGTTSPNGVVMAAAAEYAVDDANCNPVTNESAQSGSVTIDVAGPSVVSGSFDVTMTGGDHLTGSFSSPVCSVNLTSIGHTGPTACMH